jgi:hypothetical protein
VSIFIEPKPCGKVAGTLALAVALALAQSGRVKPRFDHERLNAYQASSRIGINSSAGRIAEEAGEYFSLKEYEQE